MFLSLWRSLNPQQLLAPVGLAQGSPPPDLTLDADIAAFIAEGNQPDDTPVVAEDSAEAVASADTAEAEAENFEPEPAEVADDDTSDSDTPSDAANRATSLDLSAVQKAIEGKDPAAFILALGEHAEALLGSKAHVALRLQAKEIERTQATAKGEQEQATALSKELAAKYSDPIAARKAAESGDPNAFIDMVEKWSGGHSWNDVMKWVTSCLAGRPARLEAKQRQESADAVGAAARQEQKQAEVKAWVDAGVKKLAPELHDEETTNMVVAEIRAGFSKGITTPAKALPLVRAKLQKRYESLHKVFGKGGSAPAQRRPAPSSVHAHTDRTGGTRPTTLEEDIAWTKKQAGAR